MKTAIWILIASFALLVRARAEDPVIVGHVKVVSDKVEDVSSLDAWLASTIKPGMSDAEKAKAIWASAVKFRHHDLPDAREYLGTTSTPKVYDPIKLFNVYGYCTGNPAHMSFLALARHAGLKVRHQSLFRWGAPEVWYDGAWHMYDVGMINYFPKPDGGVASVEEITAAVQAWHKANPGYHDQPDKLKAYMKDPGIKSGPALLAACPTLQPSGAYTFNYFGWYSTMLVYNVEKPPAEYEEPVTTGYEVNNRLRRGEKLTLNWANKGLHIGRLDLDTKDPETLKVAVGTKQLAYTPALGDLGNSHIGNGTLVYRPTPADLLASATETQNVRVGPDGITLVDRAKDGFIVVEMPCSYVYLSGIAKLTTTGDKESSVAVEFANAGSTSWSELDFFEGPGTHESDLLAHTFRRYNYRLRIHLNGNASLRELSIEHDFQHSQRALPAIGQGDNVITFSADREAIGTLTLEHGPAKTADKQLTAADLAVEYHRITEDRLRDDGVYAASANRALVTIPVTTPGDLRQIRVSTHYRAQDKADEWQLQVSYDGGKTFAPVGSMTGPTNGKPAAITIGNIPPGTRRALVRFAGALKQDLVLNRFRIDADYLLPRGGFAPVQVTYEWDEAGQPKKESHIARTPSERFAIHCDARPTMKSLTLELAP